MTDSTPLQLRLALTAVALYGFSVSWHASKNIIDVGRDARGGNADAQRHFTQTRYARVLGPRNSDLGMLYYGAIVLAGGSGLIARRRVFQALLAGSTTSIIMSAYLLWALFFRLRVVCPICLRGHAVNATLLMLLLALRRQRR